MELSIIKAKEISPSCKGYLIGINGNYLIEGRMINFNTKKISEKFINKIIKDIKFKNINSLDDIYKEYNKIIDIQVNKNKIIDEIKLKYYELFKQGILKPVRSDKDLFDFASNNITTLNNIDNVELFLYYYS